MAALQKFKLLATQCATARSPSRAPSAAAASGGGSPGFRLRRRKTLRMLLGRRKSYSAVEPSDLPGKRGTLRDLFVSSPPLTPDRCEAGGRNEVECGGEVGGAMRCEREVDGVWRRLGMDLLAGGGRRGFMRFGTRGLRHRLLRRTWRPVLVTIPE
ncbi:uncharacterized protein LOC110116587 [Dendrobium catenatum]|uniref:Uncharacterized protein n=1 Tax=Dendrobium catenatum TaxID=906689 RepID=A0A2I0VER4_9ASPA|nr:uncharacterized protein LOC110116587 [Dendrobium catenatum]PKU61919.1 hypothetical protein MA16_Dca017252 [Dendrobium catenatum]